MPHAQEDSQATPLLNARQIADMPEVHVRHPLNANSDVYLKRLSRAAGLQRVSLTIARVPPGKESFLYHMHERDEEFVYILSGRGRAEIGDGVHEIGPGDFMGFPAPGGPAHHLLNPYDEDLVYLMGGESSGFDIGHFPRVGRRIVFGPSGIFVVEEDALQPMRMDQWIVPESGTD